MASVAQQIGSVANDWMLARDVIASVFRDLGFTKSRAEGTAGVIIARLAAHDPPILLDVDRPCECGLQDVVCSECGASR